MLKEIERVIPLYFIDYSSLLVEGLLSAGLSLASDFLLSLEVFCTLLVSPDGDL